MKTLILMRHAKSSWKEPELADHDRPLNKRGEKDAPRMGRLLKDKKLVPDLIYSSTAVRARQTVEGLIEKSGFKHKVEFVENLYMAEPSTVIETVRQTPDKADSVLVVGHNPGLEGLVQILSRKVESLPTGSIARISLPIDHWEELSLTTEGKLKANYRPRELK
jgi:phosphohistidine phosphatase